MLNRNSRSRLDERNDLHKGDLMTSSALTRCLMLGASFAALVAPGLAHAQAAAPAAASDSAEVEPLIVTAAKT